MPCEDSDWTAQTGLDLLCWANISEGTFLTLWLICYPVIEINEKIINEVTQERSLSRNLAYIILTPLNPTFI